MMQGMRTWVRGGVAAALLAGLTAYGCGDAPATGPTVNQPVADNTAAEPTVDPAPTTAAQPEPSVPSSTPATAPAAPPAPAEAPPTGDKAPAEQPAYLPVVEVRLNRVGETLPGLKAFLDRSVPMVSALAMGEIYPVLVHTNNLDGIDGKRAIHVVLYAPNKALQNEIAGGDDNGEEIDPQKPLFAEFVPILKQETYLDKLGEEIDEIVKEGAYRKFTMKNLQSEVYFQFAGGYAVFSNSTQGVDLGVERVGAVTLAEARSAGDASAVIEIRPSELFQHLGLKEPATRKLVLDALESGFEEGMAETAEQLPPGMHLEVDPAEGRKLFEMFLELGEQTEALQLHLNIDKEAATLGMNLKAAPGSALAKKIDSVQTIDPARLRAAPEAVGLLAFTTVADPLLTQLYQKLIIFLPEEKKPELQEAIAMLQKVQGQPVSGFFGFDKNGKILLAYDFQFNAGIDAKATIQQLLAAQIKTLAQAEENPLIESKLEVGAAQELDGWTVYDNVLTTKAKNEDGEDAMEVTGKILPNPWHIAVLIRDRRVVAATGATAEEAIALGKAYIEGKTAFVETAEYATWLKKDAAERGAALYFLLDPYTIVKRVMAEELPNPKLKPLAEQTVGTLNPLLFAVYAKDGRVHGEMRIEAEAVKQWVAFVMQAQILMAGEDGGNDMPPPPPPGQGNDF